MAKVSIDQTDQLLIFHVTGSLTYDELVVQYELYGSRATKHIIWDFTNGTCAEISSENLVEFSTLAPKLLSSRLKGSKTAYVAPRDIDFRTLTMYTSFSKKTGLAPYQFRVFREINEAMEWVEGSF